MIRSLAAAAMLCALPALGRSTSPRPDAAAPRFVVIDDAVHAELAAAWDTTDVAQAERSYCLTWTVQKFGDVRVYRVTGATPARTVAAGPMAIVWYCPAGTTNLHTHPPTTCDNAGHCVWGGPEAWECYPSDFDRADLRGRGDPFSLVQCDRWALVPYFPN